MRALQARNFRPPPRTLGRKLCQYNDASCRMIFGPAGDHFVNTPVVDGLDSEVCRLFSSCASLQRLSVLPRPSYPTIAGTSLTLD